MAKKPRQPVAVVTGAASGIGKAALLRFVREGYRVAALDCSKAGLARLKRTKAGASIETYLCDLAETDTLTPLAKRIVSVMGAPRAVVNNAGTCLYADITDLTDEIWLRSLNINLIGAAALVRGFVPGMKRVRGAAIVNVASRNALSSSPRASAYDASKAGLLALTRTLGVELGPHGIRANAVVPGFIDTPIHGDLLKDRVYVNNYLKLIPLNRFGSPEDMANVIYFLASDESAFITGQYIVADGGQMSGQNYQRVFGKRKTPHPQGTDGGPPGIKFPISYVNILMLESYHREENFAPGNFGDYASQIEAYPGLLQKTVFGLGISQDGRVCGGGHMYDDSPDKGFLGCLDFELHTIRNDPLASSMPGAMFWAYYRTEAHITPDFVARLCDHYFLKGRKTPLGDGRFTQFISNPIFAHGTNGWEFTEGGEGQVGLFEYATEKGPRNLNRSSQFTSHGTKGLKMVRGTTTNRVSCTVKDINTNLVHVVSAFARPAMGAKTAATVSIVDARSREIAAKQVDVADHDPPRDWTRIIFKFIPTTPTIHVVLSDGNAAEGATLYWDFIELEDAYPAP